MPALRRTRRGWVDGAATALNDLLIATSSGIITTAYDTSASLSGFILDVSGRPGWLPPR